MNKIFSIIIPTYNVEKKIAKTLDSVISQNKELYECIIVDGSSSDNTVKIVEEYKKKFPDNIRYISETDKGIYDAMNKGIDLARGEYLYFLGAGDRLEANILDKVKFNLNFKSELIYGGVFIKKNKIIYMYKFDKYKLCIRNISHQAIFYHRSIFDIIGRYNLKYPILSDYEFNIKCFGCEKIKKRYLDLIVANYEGNGLSEKVTDHKFIEDKDNLILKFLGEEIFNLSRYNHYDLINPLNPNNLLNNSDAQIGIFGASYFGSKIFNSLKKINNSLGTNFYVKYFFDNNDKLWNKQKNNIQILKPKRNYLEEVDKIIIASLPGKQEIKKQLKNLGVHREKIVEPFI